MVPDYIADHVARVSAIHAADHARDTAYLQKQAAMHPHLRDCTDASTGGPSGPVGYEWMGQRGD